VVMRGLAKDPEARWESAAAFVEALAAALGAEPSAGSTMVMAPPVLSAAPLAETVVAERVEASPRQSVMTLAYPSPPPRPLEKRRSRKPLFALIGIGIIAALLLTALVGWVATHRPVTLSLSSNTVTVGDHVSVSADHLPPDQLGRVELWSPQYTFPFRADGAGHVDMTFTVPVGIGAGDHLVKICWSGACPAQQTLHVMELVATPSPSPSPRLSPSPSPSPARSPSPVPTSTGGRSLELLSTSIQVGTGTMSVKGSHFSPGKIVSLTFLQEPTKTNAEVMKGVVDPSGTFFLTYKIPITARQGIAYLRACDPVACAYASVTVLGLG